MLRRLCLLLGLVWAAWLLATPGPVRAQLDFLPYVDAGGNQIELFDVRMLSPQLGYGQAPAGEGLFQLYRTQSGLEGSALIWEPLGPPVDSGLHSGGISLELKVFDDRIWYCAAGGEAGAMGYSDDGGQTWTHGAQPDSAWPYRDLVRSLDRWWVAAKPDYVAYLEMPAGGPTWQAYNFSSARDFHLLGTKDYFVFSARNQDGQSLVSAKVLDSSGNVQQLSVSGRFPADFTLGDWRGSRSTNAITFLDLEDEASGRRYALVSTDMAQNFSSYGLFEAEDPFRLEEAFAPNPDYLYMSGYDQATGQRQVRTAHQVIMHAEGSELGPLAMQGDQEGNAYALRLTGTGSRASRALARLTGGYNVSRWGVYNPLCCTNGQSVTLTVTLEGVTRASTRSGCGDTDLPTWEGQADVTPTQVVKAQYTVSGCGINQSGELDFDPAQGAGRCNIFMPTVNGSQVGLQVQYNTTCDDPR